MSKYTNVPVRTANNSPLKSKKTTKSNRKWESTAISTDKQVVPCQNTILNPYAELLVETLSLHIVPLLSKQFSGIDIGDTGKILMLSVLKYLNGKKASPRRLGAFSFCIREFGSKLYVTQNHFVYENPEYANVYVNFGGSLNVNILSNGTGPKLSQKIKLPIIDKRVTKFGKELLDNFGVFAAYFDLPLPFNADFDLIDDNTMEQYIHAGVGPRMIADLTGKVTEEIVDKIFEKCMEVPLLQGLIYLIPQMYFLLSTSDIHKEWLNILIEFTDDKTFLEVIENYGTSFRFYYLTQAQQKQILGLPVDIALTEEFLNNLVFQVIKDTENGIDNKRLMENCRKYNREHINNKRRECELITGMKCSITYDVDEGEDIFHYSPVDLFTYLLDNTLHVTTTEHMLLLTEGLSAHHNKMIDESIADRIIEKIEYNDNNNLLYPPSTVEEMAEFLIHPQTSIVDQLNKIKQ